jgi:carbonic anhydrase
VGLGEIQRRRPHGWPHPPTSRECTGVRHRRTARRQRPFRLDVYRALGLAEGEAHVIRNAGGVVTDDAIRSLAISQRLLGTKEIVLIHHTDCGMLTFTDEEFRSSIEQEVGTRPHWHSEAFPEVEADVRASLQRILSSPFVPEKGSVRGFVFDVATGRLTEVR